MKAFHATPFSDALSQSPRSRSPQARPPGSPFPTWAVVAPGDKAAGADVIRSMAERAGATITEAEGSHVIMVSQLETVANVILTAAVHRSTVPLPISYEAHPGWSTCL